MTDLIKRFAFGALWTVLPLLPSRLTSRLADLAGRAVGASHIAPVRQLEANFRNLTGQEPSRRETMAAVASYYRCLAQQFALSGWSAEELRTSTVYGRIDQLVKMREDGPVVLAVTHSGNWDLAAAWFCQSYGPIVTVAERLEPRSLFDRYVRLREGYGLEVIGVSKGEKVFDTLVQQTKGRDVLVPLLADRDISGSGIEVQLGTKKALVAAGPAALALELNRPLVGLHMVYRKRRGRWILHAKVTPPIAPPAPGPNESAVEALTKAWVAAVEPLMIEGVIDWHMMQKLYVEDLDADRLRRARQRHQDAIKNPEGK